MKAQAPPLLFTLSPSGPSGARFRAWVERHLQSFFYALGQLAQQPGASALSALVIAVALALPAGLFVVLENALQVAGRWDGGAELSVFLAADEGSKVASVVAQELSRRPEVASARVITPSEGLREFKQRSGMADIEQLLDGENPLPFVIVAALSEKLEALQMRTFLAAIRADGRIARVELDLEWLARLRAIVELVERGVMVLGILLALGVLLIIGNAIRVRIDIRRDEIEIGRLFGATDAFIRRPFLYSGMLLGTCGAILAWILVIVAISVLRTPVADLAALYASGFQLSHLGIAGGAVLVSTGLSLGLLGAAVAVGRHLRATQPN